ncbi:hypothetical protein X777_14312 [Ooceraea biroi]|uniref:Histone-lysine N-methyltransferase SETMAR n=1 Tax=Ooceraea biroi TaxID=2015173 RepID=A0A026VWY2_OOCBI|nr:hypothetical protein X777_14312 [Ooceraea biroi]
MLRAADIDPDFIKNIVTADETWCFQYEPLTKRQKKIRVNQDLATVLFDSKGIFHEKFIREDQTVNADYYLSVLNCLWNRILRV